MIVTISGMPGSGKSTAGRMLAEKLGYRFYSIGDLRGKWAVERGMTISDLNRLGEKEDWTDRKADEYQAEMGRVEDGFVIDGRLSFHFIPRSFKVFLDVEPGTGVKRVFGGEARPDERWESAGGLKDGIEKRVKSDMKRYRRLYGLDFRDKSHYDLVIDTTRLTPEEVVEKILGAVKKKRI